MSLSPRYFDSHAHFDEAIESGTFSAVLADALEAGVSRMIAIGGSNEANRRAVELASAHSRYIRATVGFDRDEAVQLPDWTEAERLLASPVVAAVGETGLDYHYTPETADAQKLLFQSNLNQAARCQLPVVVHTREADDDTVALLANHVREWKGDADRVGVIHCFTGSERLARRLLNLGFYISFSGIVTFKKSEELRTLARVIPADRLLVETDAPFLAPVPHRGKRNESKWVVHVAEALASVRNDTLQSIAETTWVNATKLFGWKESL